MNASSAKGAEAEIPFRDVGCAIIHHQGRILIAQRPPGSNLAGYWEFPGGKREEGETIETCLVREAWEELRIRILPERLVCQNFHIDPVRRLALYFYLCRWTAGVPVAHGCYAWRWVEPEAMRKLRFPPADRDVIEDLIRKKFFYFGRTF